MLFPDIENREKYHRNNCQNITFFVKFSVILLS